MADISITQAYQQVLGRTPSAAELAYWTSQYGSSVDPVELSNFSVASQPERAAAPNTNDAIRQMYKQVVGREPDAAGLKYFSDRFGTDVDSTELGIFRGMAAEEVAANAAKTATTGGADDSVDIQVVVYGPDGTPYGSPAAARAAGVTNYTTGRLGLGANLSTEMERPANNTAPAGMSITQAYQKVLGRTPSASELAYWTTQFGGSVDAKELSTLSVSAQTERAAVPTTNNAVRQMYLSVLGREPDASGLKYFSDRFGADVDASELGIFKGMSSQELAANAARNAGTTTNTAGAINRPTTPGQVTGTQLAPAAVTNTAIAGTPYTSVYTPATMQQNAPTLASIQAAAHSSNPYQSLMALTPQRSMPASYTGLLGTTTANTNLGGFEPKIYKPPVTAETTKTTTGGGADGVNNSGDQRGPGTDNTGTGQTGYGNVANLAGEAQRAGFTTIGNFVGGFVPVGAEYNKTNLTTGLPEKGTFTTADLAALGNKDAIAAVTSQNQRTAQDKEQQSSKSPFDGVDVEGGDLGTFLAKGGMVNIKPQRHNPPGPDDGYAALDNGEYVIRKSAVKKYGANIFEQINAGRIPAQRLKSLLE